jgi:NAD(P)H-hydrate epimerase
MRGGKLLSAQAAAALDREASSSWGLDPLALVEAAGRACARCFTESFPGLFPLSGSPTVTKKLARVGSLTVAAGAGNNGADAMVMLRSLILSGQVAPADTAVVITRPPRPEERTPRSLAVQSLTALGVPVLVWGEGEAARNALSRGGLIIDGIAGTGLRGPLGKAALEMAETINRAEGAFRLSIDVPSGNFDAWKLGMPLVKAEATLGIEPLKACLFTPGTRSAAGVILPVGEIFPPALIDSFEGPELIRWEEARQRIPAIPADAYKHQRGVLEIHAGAPGFSGAPRIAARGAQAAGAGLIRLVVDEELYPILASSAGGIMVTTAKAAAGTEDRFRPDAILLGPGWGKGPDRPGILHKALEREGEGVPLILDADAIALAADTIFHGNAILTPHTGELAAYAQVPREELLGYPGVLLCRLARERNATIIFKSHVLFIASPDGRLGVVDGMSPVLAAGGTGDLLAGFCAAIAARWQAQAPPGFDPYTCAVIAATLLEEVGRMAEKAGKFTDPLELADSAADLAGAAWLAG